MAHSGGRGGGRKKQIFKLINGLKISNPLGKREGGGSSMTIYSETFNTNYYTDTLVLVISIVIFKLLVIVFKEKLGK